jgi:hypothetical protein
MWQAPSQRARAAAYAQKKAREKARRAIHIKRIFANLEIVDSTDAPTSETKAPVRLILNDLSTKGVGLFCSQALISGQEIILTINDPLQLSLHAKVIWCQEHSANSHILSDQPYRYRIGVEFSFPTIEEQQSIAAFYEEITKHYLYTHT